MNAISPILTARAHLFATIRVFFAARGVIEVDTTLLSPAAITDPQLHSLRLENNGDFLHTSPEFAMKKLLAAGSGDIYQLCHVFRAEEEGRKHQREFMLLEWYRLGFDVQQLMNEVADLVRAALPAYATKPVKISPYRTLFQRYLQLDLTHCDLATIRAMAAQRVAGCEAWHLDRDGYLDLLFTHFIEPHLGQNGLEFVCDYPTSQAALARVIPAADGEPVAARFELYINGLELCNGFWELADPAEQEARFHAENAARAAQNLPLMPIDTGLISALGAGFPDCAGVAVGVDRLLMLQLGAATINEVICKPFL